MQKMASFLKQIAGLGTGRDNLTILAFDISYTLCVAHCGSLKDEPFFMLKVWGVCS